jgi:DNA-binding response OmpR family regulator
VKPFALDELLARVRALLRRRDQQPNRTVLRCADLTLDPESREVRRGPRAIQLTAKEFDLLDLFMRHQRRVLRRDFILEQVWGYDFEGESNIVDVYVRYLRQKLEGPDQPAPIHTVRGVGYVLREA